MKDREAFYNNPKTETLTYYQTILNFVKLILISNEVT